MQDQLALRTTKLSANYLEWLLSAGMLLPCEQASRGIPILLPRTGKWSVSSSCGTCHDDNPQGAQGKTRRAFTIHTQWARRDPQPEIRNAHILDGKGKRKPPLHQSESWKSDPQEQPLHCNITTLNDKHDQSFKAETQSKGSRSSKLMLSFPPHPSSARSQKAPGRHRILNCLILRYHLKGNFYLK